MEENMKVIRETIFLVMREQHWSLRKTADACGMTYRGLQSILNREQNDVKLSTLLKIADGLGKPLSTLVGNE